MSIFDELYDLYVITNGALSQKEGEAISSGNLALIPTIERERELNEQMIFLYMFTRFEEKIREATANLFNLKIGSVTNTADLTAWKTIVANDRLNLMKHVAFLTPSGGTDYNIIQGFYSQRNEIAHGGMDSTILISYARSEMLRISLSF